MNEKLFATMITVGICVYTHFFPELFTMDGTKYSLLHLGLSNH